jgi:hypothetical protein
MIVRAPTMTALPRRACPIGPALVTLAISVAAAGRLSAQALTRWAVIADPALASTHVSELLPPALAAQLNLAMVEREQISAALRELELSEAFGADSSGRRLALGKLLGADALVLLRLETVGTQRLAHLVIAECRQGARLQSDRLEITDDGSEGLVESIVTQVKAVQSRFPDGVRRMVGVPYFFSRSLSQEHDRWQTQFACVLENELSSIAGIAVLETDEAAAIRREQLAADQNGNRKLVPLLIEADYRVETQAGDAVPEIRMVLKLAAADGASRTIDNTARGYADAARWLREDAAPQIAQLSPHDATDRPSLVRQLQLLDQRAASFARLGSHSHAAGLREAALLLEPDNATRGLQLVAHYCNALCAPSDPAWNDVFAKQPAGDVVVAEWRRRLAFWRRGIEALGELIDQKRITQTQAVTRLGMIESALRNFKFRVPVDTPNFSTPWGPTETRPLDEELARCTQSHLKFLSESLPRAFELPIGDVEIEVSYTRDGFPIMPSAQGISQAELRRRNRMKLIGALLDPPMHEDRRFVRPPPTADALKRYVRVLSGIGAEATETPEVTQLIFRACCEPEWRRDFTDGEFGDFLTQLRASPGPLNRYYANFGIALQSRFLQPPEKRASAEETVRTLEDLRWELEKSELLPPRNGLTGAIERARDFVIRAGSASQPAAADAPTTAAVAATSERESAAEGKSQERAAPLHYEVVPFQVRHADGRRESYAPNEATSEPGYAPRGGYPVWTAACGTQADVLVNNWSILLHREPGIVDEVALDHGAEFTGAAWDGRFAWVPSTHRGLLLLTPADGLVATLDSTGGLPQHNHGLRVAALGPGKVLAAGSFGENRRAWIGIVTFEGGRFGVRVIHEATNVYYADRNKHVSTDANMAFEVCCIQVQRDALGDGRRRIYVNRKDCGGHELEVDVEKQTVEMAYLGYGPRPAADDRGHYHFLPSGDSIRAERDGLIHVAQRNRALPDGRLKRSLIHDAALELTLGHFSWRGDWYFPGRNFVRVSPATFEVDIVGADPLRERPEKKLHDHFCSVLLGPMAFDEDGRFFRLFFDEASNAREAAPTPRTVTVVSEPDGRPLGGAGIVVYGDGGERELVAGDDGVCRFDINEPHTQIDALTAFHAGHISRHVSLRRQIRELGTGPDIRIALTPALSIGGVLRGRSGAPVPDAEILLTLIGADRRSAGDIIAPVRTDQQGRWQTTLAPLNLKTAQLRVRFKGDASTRSYGNITERVIERLLARDLEWTTTLPGAATSGPTESPSRGIVTDEEGRPISGARIRFESRGPTRETHEAMSDEEGSFDLPGLRGFPGRFVVAKTGYAAETVSPAATDGAPTIRLKKSRVLSGRVLDTDGRPLEGAQVSDADEKSADYTWRMMTGSDGRFQWENAPTGRVTVHASKDGFSRVPEPRPPPPGEEYVIRMERRATIFLEGQVLDAETSAPIQAFALTIGKLDGLRQWALQKDSPSGERFVGGQFRKKIEARSDAAVRIAAEGYGPVVIPIPTASDSSAPLEIRLQKSAGIVGVVQRPDGAPVAGVEVSMSISPQQMPRLSDGALANIAGRLLARTDASGRFRFPPQSASAVFLVACHDSGYAEVGPVEPASVPAIVLQPWGRIEGVCRTGKQRGANERIEWNSVPRSGEKWAVPKRGTTACDAAGRLVFERVPAGDIRLERIVSTADGENSARQNRVTLRIEPGRIASVEMSSSGHLFTGRVVMPAKVTYAIDQCRLSGTLKGVVRNQRPARWGKMTRDERRKWLAEHEPPEVQAANRLIRERRLPLEFIPDGYFVIDDVLPGLYELEIRAKGDGLPPELSFARHELEVTASSVASPDLGEFALGSMSLPFSAKFGPASDESAENESDLTLRMTQIALGALILIGIGIAIAIRCRSRRATL